jgi:hypothetical protein
VIVSTAEPLRESSDTYLDLAGHNAIEEVPSVSVAGRLCAGPLVVGICTGLLNALLEPCEPHRSGTIAETQSGSGLLGVNLQRVSL